MRRHHATFFLLGVIGGSVALANGCSAGSSTGGTEFTGGLGAGESSGNPGAGGNSSTTLVGTGGFVVHTTSNSATTTGATGGHTGCSQCGPTELCDPSHLGIDDNCDGNVDEGCPCTPGDQHSCFKGDYQYITTPGCAAGIEKCSEVGAWGPCVGGFHAIAPDNCQLNDMTECHAITDLPFADVDLKTGTGNFSSNADSGSEAWTVACPAGVTPCPLPGPTPPSLYTPLQSGTYTITYDKTVNGTPASCTYPLIVGAPGLRVELSWEHPTGDPNTVDMDLHLHEPDNTNVWKTDGAEQDCGYGNCKVGSFSGGGLGNSPHWFSDTATPPDAVNWDKNPVVTLNTCYNDPKDGSQWHGLNKGCHNPRLDFDDITCDPVITNPKNQEFCGPENINVDYPPTNQWFRVGVYYYSDHGNSSDFHPQIQIYCNGGLSADLGHDTDAGGNMIPSGYSVPVTFAGGSGSSSDSASSVFWLVADVLFLPQADGACAPATCIVQPLYADASMRPLLSTRGQVESGFTPAYPPIPTGQGGSGAGGH
jgi:hypothetical protein